MSKQTPTQNNFVHLCSLMDLKRVIPTCEVPPLIAHELLPFRELQDKSYVPKTSFWFLSTPFSYLTTFSGCCNPSIKVLHFRMCYILNIKLLDLIPYGSHGSMSANRTHSKTSHMEHAPHFRLKIQIYINTITLIGKVLKHHKLSGLH